MMGGRSAPFKRSRVEQVKERRGSNDETGVGRAVWGRRKKLSGRSRPRALNFQGVLNPESLPAADSLAH
jgi:hypothetical protein